MRVLPAVDNDGGDGGDDDADKNDNGGDDDAHDDDEDDDEDDDDDEALRVLLPRFVVGRVLHFFSRRVDVRFWGGLHREKRWRNKRKRNVLEK